MKRNLTFHSDPNHSWLEVPLGDLTTLGVAGKISAYSYQDETNVYLEEDVDAYVYLRAARQAGWKVTTEDRYVDRDSFVRNLPPYGSRGVSRPLLPSFTTRRLKTRASDTVAEPLELVSC